VKERSYSSNNKNSDLFRQRKVPSIWAWEMWATTKAAKPIFTQGVREEESTRTMRTASRSSKRRLCERKGTVCRVFWRLARIRTLVLFGGVTRTYVWSSQEGCGNFTSLFHIVYSSLHIHSKPNIWRYII
jgi:hypothetical protein